MYNSESGVIHHHQDPMSGSLKNGQINVAFLLEKSVVDDALIYQ